MTAETITSERWLPVTGWPYEVSSLGRVRRALSSPKRAAAQPGRLLNPFNFDGYRRVCLSDGKRRRIFFVHVLVVEAFIGPKPSGRHEIAHADGARANNAVPNLRWVTGRENAQDRERHGRTSRGAKHGMASLSADDVVAIRDAYARGGITSRDLGQRHGVSGTHVVRIVNRRARKLA